MSFPANPSNGQAAIVNKITYQYSSATNTWTKLTSLPTYLANLTANNSITIGNLTMNGNLTNITAAGNLYIGGTGVFGTALNYVPANAPVQVGFNINNYSQFSIQNANTGNNASTDIAAIANNGSDNDTYVDMGIIGSGYSQASYNLYNPNDGYLIVAGNTITQGGNLILNTYQANDIIFATGGTQKNNEVMRVTSANVVNIKSTNTSTSTTTGALIVAGGAGVAGNLNVGGNTVVTGTSTFSSYISAPNTFGFKNRIINGAMVIDQRNAGASVTIPATTVTYDVDRWAGYGTQASKFTLQQSSSAPAGFVNSIVATSSSSYSVGATDEFIIQQTIEGFNIADLGWGTANAQAVTLSFWVQSSLTGTFGGTVTGYSNALSYTFGYTISSANTWTKIIITIPGPTTTTWNTTNGGGMVVRFSLGAGSSQSTASGSWTSGFYFSVPSAISVVGTNGATFYITGVQLEKGSTATSFDYRPYGTELALCQRYCFKYTVASNYGPYFMAHGIGTTTGRGLLKFPQTMRSNPALTFPAASSFQWSFGNVFSSIALAEQGFDQSSIDFTTTGLAANGGYMVTSANNTTSYILASAEL